MPPTPLTLPIRPDDCDSFGHVNNAVYISQFQYALATRLSQFGLAEDWLDNGEYFWQPGTLEIEYRQAAVFGDVLTAALWLSEPDSLRPVFGFEIRRSNTPSEAPQPITRARAVWQRTTRQTGDVVRLSDDLLAAFPRQGGALPRSIKLAPDPPPVNTYTRHHTVQRVELGPTGRVHLQTVYRWMEESVFAATDQGGWPPEKRLAAGFLVFQMRHATDIRELPRQGETVEITSRLFDVRRFRGTWRQEIHTTSDRRLLVCNDSTGVFVDLQGRPATPPADMMHDLQYGPS